MKKAAVIGAGAYVGYKLTKAAAQFSSFAWGKLIQFSTGALGALASAIFKIRLFSAYKLHFITVRGVSAPTMENFH